MKRIVFFAAAFAAFLLPIFSSARKTAAEENSSEAVYAVAAKEEVWLYADAEDESGVCILPFSYYVRILGEEGDYYSVEYAENAAPYLALSGYCKKEDLTEVSFLPERPYLKLELTVLYYIDGNAALTMGKGSFNSLTRTFLYYGTSYLGTARYYYVLHEGIFDYIPATQEIVYEYNTDYLAPAPDPEPPEETEEEPHSSPLTGAHVAALCALGVSAAAIAVFVLRGKRPSTPDAAEF